MLIGLHTPGVTAVPGLAAPWEAQVAPGDIATLVSIADGLGFDYVTCSDHVAVPVTDAAARGAVYWDPLATLAFLAACSWRIRLVTAVLVLPYHHPLEVVKRYGTLDLLSGGRVILGVGVGSLRAEFELLGADWARRGAVTDERIDAIRAAWGQPVTAGFAVQPAATSAQVPIWVGGRTMRSLRRAIERGDGWMPFGLTPDQVRSMLQHAGAPTGLEIVLSTPRPLDPVGNPAGARRSLDRLRDVGATAVTCAIDAVSAAHYEAQLAALGQIITEGSYA